MKLGYLHMIWKPSDNQYSGSQHHLEDPKKKARMSRSKFKAMLIVFFDIQDIVMAEWVPTARPAVLHWSLDKIAWIYEKETTKIMEKQVDFVPGQRASPQLIVCESIFS